MDVPPEDQSRFWSRVDVGGPDECWEWLAGKTTGGYGSITIDGDQWYAHRLTVVLDGRELGDRWALHHCDNPSCVNPNHVYIGGPADNLADASERTEWPSYNVGEDSGNAKLTERDVREIRARYDSEDINQQDLADEYGVSQMAISRVVREEYWTHVS